jgi:hypothetical protein
MKQTEHRGRVVNIPASYLGGPGFKSRSQTGYSDSVFRGFTQSLQANAGIES